MDAEQPAIVARGLTRRFGDLTAVDGLDLDIPRGRVYGFLGPNGSGKSTAIRMLSGLLLPSAGRIRVLGLEIPAHAEALKRRAGYMTQSFSLYGELSVFENLAFIARLFGLRGASRRRRIEELMATYRLTGLRTRLAGTLSGGERKRLALAAAVLNRPELLFLDEPTSAVDPQTRRDFWEVLFGFADAGTTILVSTHHMDEAERCHGLAILQAGRLVAEGSPDTLRRGIDGVVLLAETDRPREAEKVLIGEDGVRSCAQIGNRLRVLVDDADRIGRLRQRLEQAGLKADIRITDANLEDVFVAATHHAGAPS